MSAGEAPPRIAGAASETPQDPAARALRTEICREITTGGPMSVARYMDLCLGHPQHGYYTRQDPFGASGDFVTAPEISQMFGEMVGLWAASVWQSSGAAKPRLIELGPGRGTLMADVLRVFRQLGATPDVWFVETSPSLRRAQAERVPKAQWTDRPEDVPDGPAIILANEFLDALPVRQFLRADAGWCERLIGAAPEGDGLIWGLSPPLPSGPRIPGSRTTGAVGDWAEVSSAADGVLDWLATRLAAGQTGALVIDYGYTGADRPAGPTLQALRRHEPADPLAAPGMADLTWLPDFDRIAARLDARLAPQGAFLARMGIGPRASALSGAAPDAANDIADALERLTAPGQMGTLFKVAGAVSADLPTPPGFEE